MMKHEFRRYSRAILALGVAGLALLAGETGCDSAPPRVDPPPPKVSVAHPEQRAFAEFDEYNGWIDAAETVEVRARVRGHIEKVHFIDGQIVKTGDLLFELDPRPFQQEIDRSVEQVNIYQAQLDYALVEEKRLKQMESDLVASAIEVETAEAKVKSLAAQVEAQKKEVERRRLELEYARVTAPIAGRISRAMLTTGNLVNAGGSDPLLTTIVSVDPSYIYFSVDERALQRWMRQRRSEAGADDQSPRNGTRLRDANVKILFAMETDQGFPHEAVLDFADNQIDRATGTIIVRAVVPNPAGQFVSGSRVRVRIPTSAENTVTLVPDTAILTDQDKKYVLAVDEKNVVQRRDVNPGRLLDDGMRVVLPNVSGAPSVTSDDWIVVIGLQMARINYPVDPVRPTTQPAQAVSLGQ